MPYRSLDQGPLNSPVAPAHRTGMPRRPPKSDKREGNPFVPRTTNLKKLQQASQDCKNCDLWEHGTQTVFGEGQPQSKVMFIGEQPGNEEDLQESVS